MQFTQDESATLLRILQWRRDVRHFRPDPVNEAVLERLRATMDCAPSVGNARPWRVIRVDDAGLRANVRANFNRCNAEAAQLYSGDKHAEYLARCIPTAEFVDLRGVSHFAPLQRPDYFNAAMLRFLATLE